MPRYLVRRCASGIEISTSFGSGFFKITSSSKKTIRNQPAVVAPLFSHGTSSRNSRTSCPRICRYGVLSVPDVIKIPYIQVESLPLE